MLNPLASGEVVLTEQERQMGVAVCDIGGGTTDLAIYVDGDVWHTMVLAVGGNHITQDIAHGLRLPVDPGGGGEEAAGTCRARRGRRRGIFQHPPVWRGPARADQPPGPGAHHRGARRGDLQPDPAGDQALRLRRSAAAGMVLTGGTSACPGIKRLAAEVLGMPVRTAQPENLTGLVDRLNSPAYSTSVGCCSGR